MVLRGTKRVRESPRCTSEGLGVVKLKGPRGLRVGVLLTERDTIPQTFLPVEALPHGSKAGILGRGESMRSFRWMSARLVGSLRGRHLLVLDLLGVVAAAYVVLVLRYDNGVGGARFVHFLPIVVVLVAVRVTSNLWFGLYNRSWRFATVPDVQRIVAAVLVGSAATFGIVVGASWIPGVELADGFPRSFWLAEMLMSGAVFAGVRFGIRAASEWAPRSAPVAVADHRATLFYGAGRTGVLMARSARRKPDAGVVPVGFLDDDSTLAGGLIANLPVFGGLEALDRAVARTGAEALLITMPSAPGKTIRSVVDAAMARGLVVRTVPSMSDLLDGTLDAYRVRRVQVEDLLRRPTGTEHAPSAKDMIRDRTVLVTGAGGSIGSELARQVFALRPRRLVLVDRAESALYLVQVELEARRRHDPALGDVRAHLMNVASRPAMKQLISEERPDIIFHAAAYKHVPMLETHPSDAVHVNIGGTLALLDAAEAAGTERFVLVSTDKAVKPSSVMGASKRIAEMLVADSSQRTGRPYVSVRFGNVLGSNGSVVPIFQEQLEKSEPLTITHPDMSRYFMTIAEASWLIVDAAAIGRSGDLFVLDMGEPIRIVDLARDLVRLAGRDPDTQPIKIVGLRQGEKLHEELFYEAERVQSTSVAKVLRAVAEAPPASVRDDIRHLLDMATGGQEHELRIALLDYATHAGHPKHADHRDPDQPAMRGIPIESEDESRRVSNVR